MRNPNPDIKHFRDCLPEQSGVELTRILAQNENVRIERIESNGKCSPEGFWYDQNETEWVMLLVGIAELEFESGEVLKMSSGEFITIEPHQKHRVSYTSDDAVWLAVFY